MAQRDVSIIGFVRSSAVGLAWCAASLAFVSCAASGGGDPPHFAHAAPVWDRQTLWETAAAPGLRARRAGADGDGDGIDDATEMALAKAYFPYYSLDPGEHCSRHGVVFRLRPHPLDPDKVAIWYVVLYERDCGRFGFGGHVGDDEGFSAVIDPRVPPPSGILALRAISHQNTLFEHKTNCGRLPGCQPCRAADISGKPYPVVFASSSKHGQYVSERTCNLSLNDFSSCGLSETPDEPPFVNAGEPDSRLCADLTTEGFVTPENGWAEPSLMHFDPWANRKFGKAGNLTDDLVDDAFVIAPDRCR